MQNLFRPIINCEGILGTGKSTFCKEIATRLNYRLIEEEVEKNPYLEPFYKDPKSFAFSMQIYLLHKRFAATQLASYESLGIGGYAGSISDRGIQGDNVFCKLHMEAGNISKLDYETYQMAYLVMSRTLLPPTTMIFLDVQPETAYNRMKKRNRNAEAGVPLDYLVKLRAGYLELIDKAEKGLLPFSARIRILRIPWDVEMPSKESWDALALTVRDFCEIKG